MLGAAAHVDAEDAPQGQGLTQSTQETGAHAGPLACAGRETSVDSVANGVATATVAEHDARRHDTSGWQLGALYADVLASSAVRRPLMEALFASAQGPRVEDSVDQLGVGWAVRVFLNGLMH